MTVNIVKVTVGAPHGWSHCEGDGDRGERFVAVQEIPPLNRHKRLLKWRFTVVLSRGN